VYSASAGTSIIIAIHLNILSQGP
jgi:hypothetical protein